MNRRLVLFTAIYSLILATVTAALIVLCFTGTVQALAPPDGEPIEFMMIGIVVLLFLCTVGLWCLALFCLLPILASNLVFGVLFCIQRNSPERKKVLGVSCWMIVPEFFLFSSALSFPFALLRTAPLLALLLFLYALSVLGGWILRLVCRFKEKKEE